MTGVNVTYPTTQQFDPRWVGEDLTGSLGSVVGNVDPYAVDQFIVPTRQTERLGSFFDTGLFEQDETNVVNSKFMTGAANSISPDKFKSKVSNKTALRMEFPLKTVSTLSVDSSSIHYFNPTQGRFEKVADESSRCVNGGGDPSTFAPVLFTPYGMHLLPIADSLLNGFGGGGDGGNLAAAQIAYRRVITYAGDGSDVPFFSLDIGFNSYFITASLLNPLHAGNVTQSIDMTSYLSQPFLLEKIVVEFPFQAGPGWLNDRFGIREAMNSDLEYTMDTGGPMITFALLRRDGPDGSLRDLIASGTITTLMDMTTGSYNVATSTYVGLGGYKDVIATPEGVGYFINPSVVITGSVLSGSDNFYTGSIKLIMDPQITSHVWRQRVSGSATFFLGVGTGDGGPPRPTQANGLTFGPIARRSSKNMESGRSILGNQFALISPDRLNGSLNPIVPMDDQFENGTQKQSSPNRVFKSKTYYDVVSQTTKSPYLLYPEDKLVLAISKHRAAGTNNAGNWDILFQELAMPTILTSYHDVAIGSGLMKVTLYGDLVKEDTEFHDTLNQRLETEELWQDVGEEPVLDQFDVVYRGELSGSYLDRFSVLNAIASYGTTDLTSSMLTRYYSNFSSKINNVDSAGWSSEYGWSRAQSIETLKKNNRNVNLVSDNEKFWDSRIPDPLECIKTCNPNYRLLGLDTSLTTISFVLYTGDGAFAHDTFVTESGRGIGNWMMTYPYDQRYQGLTFKFSNTLTRDLMIRKDPGSAGTFLGNVPYKALALEIGHSGSNGIHRRICSEDDTNFSVGHNGLTTSEFIKAFYGIGDGSSNVDNQHVTFRQGVNGVSQSVVIRGWRHGMMSAFPLKSQAVYRRDRFGQPRDLLEQRLDAKFFDELGLSPDGTTNGVVGVKTGPVQVYFYDSAGKLTDPLKTLSSNVSFEATSSVPYFDGSFRNRPAYDFSILNIKSVII